MSLVFCAICFSGLLGCETPFGGGGGSGASAAAGPGASPVIAVDPIDLAPGQTQAVLAWPASEGPIENYLVFESRNGSGFTFSQLVPNASANVSGQPGDRLQITVIGVSPTGEVSEASPASPPLIFHASAAAVVAQSAATAGLPSLASAEPGDASATGDPLDGTPSGESLASADAEGASDDDSETGSDGEAAEANEPGPLTRQIRALLLGHDARLPERGLSAEASRWLQGRVDLEMSAGVSLAGTGRANDDALREIVWLDQAGQLFVSDGQRVIDDDELPDTLDEALRLRMTERFVGLADFDGDGRGDWLIEDTATGDVWMINGDTEQNLPAHRSELEARLAGLGDIDGDGLSELFWLSAENRLQVTRPGGAAPTLTNAPAGPVDFELLAIADLDGNGRDDLLGRTSDGRLAMALALESDTPGSSGVRVEWRTGSADPSAQLDLVATVDYDEDGRAEIAWLNGEAIEIWSAETGLETTLGL